MDWNETLKGKNKDFYIANILGGGGIRNGFINLEFTLSMGEYLVQLPITQFPLALLSLDERNSNAYTIGLKMSKHFNMYNNQVKGTAQLLKIKTLLAIANFPTITQVRKKGQSWRERIKEPFEKCLDILTQNGFLKDWEYCHSKGLSLNDEEADFDVYESWENILIKFKIKDTFDHTLKLKAKG